MTSDPNAWLLAHGYPVGLGTHPHLPSLSPAHADSPPIPVAPVPPEVLHDLPVWLKITYLRMNPTGQLTMEPFTLKVVTQGIKALRGGDPTMNRKATFAALSQTRLPSHEGVLGTKVFEKVDSNGHSYRFNKDAISFALQELNSRLETSHKIRLRYQASLSARVIESQALPTMTIRLPRPEKVDPILAMHTMDWAMGHGERYIANTKTTQSPNELDKRFHGEILPRVMTPGELAEKYPPTWSPACLMDATAISVKTPMDEDDPLYTKSKTHTRYVVGRAIAVRDGLGDIVNWAEITDEKRDDEVAPFVEATDRIYKNYVDGGLRAVGTDGNTVFRKAIYDMTCAIHFPDPRHIAEDMEVEVPAMKGSKDPPPDAVEEFHRRKDQILFETDTVGVCDTRMRDFNTLLHMREEFRDERYARGFNVLLGQYDSFKVGLWFREKYPYLNVPRGTQLAEHIFGFVKPTINHMRGLHAEKDVPSILDLLFGLRKVIPLWAAEDKEHVNKTLLELGGATVPSNVHPLDLILR